MMLATMRVVEAMRDAAQVFAVRSGNPRPPSLFG